MKRILSILLIALCTLGVQAQFGIRVNGTDVYPATHTDDFEGFSQYLAHIYVNAGDYCELYDINNAVAWTKPLNSASVSAFTLQNNRYVCSAAGCYDFYIKIKLNADELYIGPGSDCTNTPGEGGGGGTTPIDFTSAVPSQCTDVMLQAFYWKSNTDNTYGTTKWTVLQGQADEIASYFQLVWLSPSCRAKDEMGYLPSQYSNQSCRMGGSGDLSSLISALHAGGARVIADVVINHAGSKSTWNDFFDQNFGEYGTFSPNSSWITSNDEAKDNGYSVGTNPDDGQESNANYPGTRDWDHKNTNVQAMCRAYLKWLKNVIGYDGFRFDYCGGYHVSHVNDYVSSAKPYVSVMEYWNGNASVLKQRIDDAGKNTMTFDFASFYTCYQQGLASNNYGKLKNPGLRGQGYAKYAVNFVDNHDTFNRSDINNTDCGNSTDGSTSLNNRNLILQSNAYMLSMPGIPCVFWPHWYRYKSEIKAMITARRKAGVHSESSVSEQSGSGWYKATVNGKYGNVILYLGSAANEATPAGYTQAIKDGKVAMYYTGNGDPQDIESIQPSALSNQKFVKDGQLYIRCGERVYDAQGKWIH